MNEEQSIVIQELKTEFESYWQAEISNRYPQDSILGKAITYAASGGGKRIRPLLTLLFCKSLGGDYKKALPAAAAVEMIHTYSLVHDDLPCMDNDDYRRGRKSTHIEFTENTALLVGDALLTDAFEVISDSAISDSGKVQCIAYLSKAAGSSGMVRGQMLDLFWTQRTGATKANLDEIHSLKTGRIISAACALGAICANTGSPTVQKLIQFGELLGLAFQIKDDLIDENEGTGKSKGKDLEAGKLTYLALMSPEEALNEAQKKTDCAIEILMEYVQHPDILIEFSTNLFNRDK